jgi:hypothetical protein
MSIIDKGLHFGLQNYFFVTQDETDPTYVYVAYMNRKGSTLIGRFKKDDTEGLYYVTVGTFAVIWAGRAGYVYVLPSLLTDPIV